MRAFTLKTVAPLRVNSRIHMSCFFQTKKHRPRGRNYVTCQSRPAPIAPFDTPMQATDIRVCYGGGGEVFGKYTTTMSFPILNICLLLLIIPRYDNFCTSVRIFYMVSDFYVEKQVNYYCNLNKLIVIFIKILFLLIVMACHCIYPSRY